MSGKFRQLVSKRVAAYVLLAVLSLVIVFHVLVMTGLVPFRIVWGGRLENVSQMVIAESVSLVVNLSMFIVVAGEASLFKVRLSPKVTTLALWVMTFLFFINTLGNVFSVNQLERFIFTPLTVVLCILSFRLAIDRAEIRS